MTINVMLVDDEAPSRDYIRGLIDWNAHGYCIVAEAQSVDEALAQLATCSIQLVLMDVYMPGKTGADLSREIANRYSHVMMIAISSYDNYEYVREILLNGAHDYILKHRLDGEKLLQLLQSVRQKIQPNMRISEDQHIQRSRVADWLLNGRPCPFSKRDGRKVIAVARLATDGSRLEEPLVTGGGFTLQETLRTGVQQIIESSVTAGEQTAIAVFSPPRYFIICTCFPDTVSESRLQNAVNINNIRGANSIRLLYKTNIQFVICSLACPVDRLPQHVHELLAGDWMLREAVRGGISIADKKSLLTALEQRSIPQVQHTLQDIFAVQVSGTALLMLVHELTAIFDNAVQEYGVALTPLTPQQQQLLCMPTQDTIPQLCEMFCERFAQVIPVDIESSHYSDNIRNANSFMEKYYGSSVSLHTIAKEIGVSASYLSRRYRQETGITVIDYLTRIRVDAAKKHIDKGATLKEAAFVCGFSSYNYFFKVFKDCEGITPKEYTQHMNKR